MLERDRRETWGGLTCPLLWGYLFNCLSIHSFRDGDPDLLCSHDSSPTAQVYKWYTEFSVHNTQFLASGPPPIILGGCFNARTYRPLPGPYRTLDPEVEYVERQRVCMIGCVSLTRIASVLNTTQ